MCESVGGWPGRLSTSVPQYLFIKDTQYLFSLPEEGETFSSSPLHFRAHQFRSSGPFTSQHTNALRVTRRLTEQVSSSSSSCAVFTLSLSRPLAKRL